MPAARGRRDGRDLRLPSLREPVAPSAPGARARHWRWILWTRYRAPVGGKPAVTTTAIVYRGYEIIITSPVEPTDQWRVLIWPLKQGAPIPMPAYASENEAAQAARSVIDQQLDAR
jgi:hypothetical protein